MVTAVVSNDVDATAQSSTVAAALEALAPADGDFVLSWTVGSTIRFAKIEVD